LNCASENGFGVLTLDTHGAVTSLNSAAERLLGVRASMVVGRPLEDALHRAAELAAWVRSALDGRGLFQETDLSLSGTDARRLTVRVSAAELRDESGRSDGLIVLLRDVTEVSRLELQLRRADKLAALGTLAAGVAHEVKNPLHALNLNLHLLVQELDAPQPSKSELDDYLGILRSEIERIHRIVENFLRFSKPSIPEVKPLDLSALVERVLSLVAFEATGHGVTLHTDFAPELETIAGDEGQLAQVVLNLVINGLQAMPAGGQLTLVTRPDNGWAELMVRDTGEGIPQEAIPQIFDPYFTTRPGAPASGSRSPIESSRATMARSTWRARPGRGPPWSSACRWPVCGGRWRGARDGRQHPRGGRRAEHPDRAREAPREGRAQGRHGGKRRPGARPPP